MLLSFNGTRNAFASIPQSLWSKQTIAVLGCGPVGMCAIVSALEYKPAQVFAIDSVAERLERAKELGAIPLNFKTDDVKAEIKKATKNRGADAVIEVVGHEDALRTAFELVRFGGKISVIGELQYPKTSNESSLIIMGVRCSQRSRAIQCLRGI